MDSRRHAERRPQLHQQLLLGPERPKSDRLRLRSVKAGHRAHKRRDVVCDSAGQPKIRQNHLGGRDGLHAHFAVAKCGTGAVRSRAGGGGCHQGRLRRAGAHSNANTAIPTRIENKLAYALANTTVEMQFFHYNNDPPLETYYLPAATGEFYFNELGWQDLLTVTVHHNLTRRCRAQAGSWRSKSSVPEGRRIK